MKLQRNQIKHIILNLITLDMDQFIDDFLRKANAEIDTYNAKIDKEHVQDLF